jgi:hypothetical protein
MLILRASQSRGSACTRRIGLCAVLIGFALGASQASAGTGSINYPPAAAGVSGNASVSVSGGVDLAQDGVSVFLVRFVLPPDYVSNEPVDVAVYLTAQNEPCTATIVPFSLTRFRADRTATISLTGVDGGLPTVDFPANNKVVRKVFVINPGTVLLRQHPGDLLALSIERDGGNASDNCVGLVFVQGIEIQYPQAP